MELDKVTDSIWLCSFSIRPFASACPFSITDDADDAERYTFVQGKASASPWIQIQTSSGLQPDSELVG